MPYSKPQLGSECQDFPWGSVCFFHDPLQGRSGAVRRGGALLVAVGDLLLEDPEEAAGGFCARAAEVRDGRADTDRGLGNNRCFDRLNGAFAILLADEKGPSIITDPLGSVQVYVARDRDGGVTALGTHPDLVACVGNGDDEVDPVSVFEFLNAGTPCFPHTMHRRVRELAPGRLHVVRKDANGQPGIADVTWWQFPDEYDRVPEEGDLAASLGKAFAAAVRDRCQNGTVGITLSGGMDSRLVMAAVPESTRCIGFTFCDVLNREARIARKVAQCFGREWVPLFRDRDYIARTAIETVGFIGCEGDWVNAHGLGFTTDIAQYRPTTVLTGLLMNNNVKGYYAADVRRVPRGWGLLPPAFEIVPFDYVNGLKPFSSGAFRTGLWEESTARRKAFLAGHPGLKRQSPAEWLDGYPFSQAPDNTAWVAERRVMPVRLPAMDRRLLEIACRIPMGVKAGGRLFIRMATSVLGKGAQIPDANDGVRPGSNHVSRLVQRAIRKMENSGREGLGRLGLKLPVPHSWHDYQSYWRESQRLGQLKAEHGKNLNEFEGRVFQGAPQPWLADPALSWESGFRLVQLAVWMSALGKYRAAARDGRVQPG